MALYPPIVASSMPAFDINEGKVRIYYTLSNYNGNKKEDIKAVHVTVRRQSSNVNKVNNPYEILEKTFIESDDPVDKLLHRYYIEINNSEIIKGFEADVLYKVQLRFSSMTNTGADNFFTNNINNFSEWSTVCIIKPINPPEFYIDDFYVKGETPSEDDVNNFNYNLADFVGIFKTYNEKTQITSTETLKTWRIRLLNQNYTKEEKINIDNYTLSDSGEKTVSAYNYTLDNESVAIECSLPYELQEDKTYKLLFEITTKNDFSDNILYTFIFKPTNISALTGKLETFINEEQGYIKVEYNSSDTYLGNLVLRRSDSSSNFLKWEDLKNFESHQTGSFNYYDFTAESGIAYRYLVQKRDVRGRRGTPLYDQTARMNKATIAEWEHAFLLETTGNGDATQAKQLKLKFDFQISSLKTNISESKTDTIGAKYPFIRRNGNMYYRSFPCSGTITAYMDNVNLFTSKDILNDNYSRLYDEFNGINNTYGVQYDYTYERKFREKVEEFLYNIKPKLYKSMQEGNIFIKLMEVSLTPKNQLGRLIYTFSATAYQIDEATIANFDAYGLLHIGNYNPYVSFTDTKISQVSSFQSDENPMGKVFKAGQDIIGTGKAPAANSIAKHHKYLEAFNNQVVDRFEISWLRITIESEPYLIKQVGNKFYPIDDVDNVNSTFVEGDRLTQQRAGMPSFVNKKYIQSNNTVDNISNAAFDIPSGVNYNPPLGEGNINYKLYQIESTYDDNNIYLGTLFDIQINGQVQQIIISHPNNIYQFRDQNITLPMSARIVPYKDTAMSIDYVIHLNVREDTSKVPKFIRINHNNGQLIGTFNSNQQIINRIKYKYKHSFSEDNADETISQYVNSINNVLVDTEPGAIILLKTTADNRQGIKDPHRFVVNHTGELLFDPNDSITYISQLYIAGMNIPAEDLYDRGTVSSLEQVEYPIDKDLCTVNGNVYIFYQKDWYKATIQDKDMSYDINCPVDALIFYDASVRRDYF